MHQSRLYLHLNFHLAFCLENYCSSLDCKMTLNSFLRISMCEQILVLKEYIDYNMYLTVSVT